MPLSLYLSLHYVPLTSSFCEYVTHVITCCSHILQQNAPTPSPVLPVLPLTSFEYNGGYPPRYTLQTEVAKAPSSLSISLHYVPLTSWLLPNSWVVELHPPSTICPAKAPYSPHYTPLRSVHLNNKYLHLVQVAKLRFAQPLLVQLPVLIGGVVYHKLRALFSNTI